MVVKGRKEHRALIVQGIDQDIDDGGRLARARRTLHIGHRILERLMRRGELVHVDVLVKKDERKLPATHRTLGQVPKERLYGHGRLAALIHRIDTIVLPLQVNGGITRDDEEVRNVIDEPGRADPLGHEVLDTLAILVKGREQMKVLLSQVAPDGLALKRLPVSHDELATQYRVMAYDQCATLGIKTQLSIGDDIEATRPAYREDVERKLLKLRTKPFVRIASPVLSSLDNGGKLFPVKAERPSGKGVLIDTFDEREFLGGGRYVEPAAIGQVVKDVKVRHCAKDG